MFLIGDWVPKKYDKTFALQALHEFDSIILIIDSEKDTIIFHQIIQNYVDTLKNKGKLLMKDALQSRKPYLFKEKVTKTLVDRIKKIMKILLIGASSYVGARIYFDLKNKFELVGTYNNNPLYKSFVRLNITDKNNLLRVFNEVKPEIVIHVANYPSSRSAINNEDNFIKLNDNGTINVVENANKIGAKVIFISSQAANNATDIYGKLKAKSEKLVSTTKTGYLILRPSMIVGFSPNTTNPRLFNRILKCLDDSEITGEFDTSWKLKPTYLGHLSQVIEKTINNDIWNKVIPIFIDEIVTKYQIAWDILSKFNIKIKQVDQHINIPPSKDDLKEFNSFNLFPHTYKDMIEFIIQEIKERDKFKL